jgi:hypothetical protein
MKKILLISTSLLFFVLAAAFVPKQTDTTSETAVYKLMEVTFLWDFLKNGYEPDRDRDDTWLDVGFRSKYAMAKKYASLELLEKAFGEPVFIVGPHGKDMNFKDKTSFGHYNPAFITKLEKAIELAAYDAFYAQKMKNVYENHLKSMAETYHAAYLHLHKDKKTLKKLTKKYTALIDQPEGTTEGSLQETFRDFAEELEKNEKGDVYEGFTAPAFWLRRSIDGTDKQFFDLLERVMKAMDSGEKAEETKEIEEQIEKDTYKK